MSTALTRRRAFGFRLVIPFLGWEIRVTGVLEVLDGAGAPKALITDGPDRLPAPHPTRPLPQPALAAIDR